MHIKTCETRGREKWQKMLDGLVSYVCCFNFPTFRLRAVVVVLLLSGIKKMSKTGLLLSKKVAGKSPLRNLVCKVKARTNGGHFCHIISFRKHASMGFSTAKVGRFWNSLNLVGRFQRRSFIIWKWNNEDCKVLNHENRPKGTFKNTFRTLIFPWRCIIFD